MIIVWVGELDSRTNSLIGGLDRLTNSPSSGKLGLDSLIVRLEAMSQKLG